MRIFVQRSRIGLALAAIIGFLVFANLLFHFGRLELGWGQAYGLRRQFNLAQESNIPTFYSTVALLLAAVLLLLIATRKYRERDRYRFHWIGLAVGFLYMSIDEFAMIHENVYRLPVALGYPSDSAYWLVPYAALFLFLAVTYRRFLFHLDPVSRRIFLAAAVIFVAGAVGLEFVGDLVQAAHGQRANWSMVLVTTAEESMEMIGIAVFIVGLLRYMERAHMRVEFTFGSQEAQVKPGLAFPGELPDREAEPAFRVTSGASGWP